MGSASGKGPAIGDLVQDGEGHRMVVTDIRRGKVVLRSATGPFRETPELDPPAVTVLARRGSWT